MFDELAKESENSRSSEIAKSSKETKKLDGAIKSTATADGRNSYSDDPATGMPPRNQSSSALHSPNYKEKAESLASKSRVFEQSNILKDKAVFETKKSLSPPVSSPNSSSFFPVFLKIDKNQLIHTSTCASPSSTLQVVQSSPLKSCLTETPASKHDTDHSVNSSSSQVNSKDSPTACYLDDLSKNSGALNELATGSLATCSSILEVGKEDQQKQKNLNALSAAKLRLYIASDKIPKHLFENRKLSRHANGLESERNSNSLDIARPSLQSTKSSMSSKSPINDSSKLASKSSERYGVKSDFCQVYSCEQFLDTNAKSSSHKPAARKSVIELKSKSLDPPLFESDFNQPGPVTEEASLSFQQSNNNNNNNNNRSCLFPCRLPSRSLSQHHPDGHPSLAKRRDSETAVLTIDDSNWLQKIAADKQESPVAAAENPNNSPKVLNIQKLKSFFGETTPKIMEGKAGLKKAAKDDLCIKPNSLNFQRRSEYASCKYTSSSGAKAKKSSTLCFKDSGNSPQHVCKKGQKERDSSGSPRQLGKEHKTWRGKMAQTLKRYGSGATPPCEQYTGALGVPLEHCVSSFANQYVPLIVEACTRIVEERGLGNVGVYRVPGNSGAVNAVIELLNKDPYALCLENERWQDVNLVSSLLKLFFRKLPDSLITEDLYESFIAANRLENPERRMLKVKKLIHELPEHNFETLSFLAQHLNRVASHEEENKMDSHNLAIMFGPTLVRPQDDGMVLMVKDMQDQVKVVETIITHCDWLFSSWDEDVYVPIDGDDDDPVPISGMNSVLLEKAEKIDNRSSLSF